MEINGQTVLFLNNTAGVYGGMYANGAFIGMRTKLAEEDSRFMDHASRARFYQDRARRCPHCFRFVCHIGAISLFSSSDSSVIAIQGTTEFVKNFAGTNGGTAN